MSLTLVALTGCYSFAILDSELGVCGGAELGRMRAEGFGVDRPSAGSDIWLAPFAGVSAAWPHQGRLQVRAGIGASLPLRRPSFVLEGIGGVHRASAVTGRASLSLDLHFW